MSAPTTVNSVITNPAELLHVCTPEDFAVATGIAIPTADEPVYVGFSYALAERKDLSAFCGFMVYRDGLSRGEVATTRALRAEPSWFEGETMCGDCLRVFARLKTDGQQP